MLAREEAGATMIIAAGGLAKLGQLLSGKDTEILQAAARVLSTLAKASKDRVCTHRWVRYVLIGGV